MQHIIDETTKKIIEDEKIIYLKELDTIYKYSRDGIYVPYDTLPKKIEEIIGLGCRTNHVKEVIEKIKRRTITFIDNTIIDDPSLLPCQDCIVDMEKIHIDHNLNIVWEEDAFIEYDESFIFFDKHPIYSPRYLKKMGKSLFVLPNKINKYVSSLFDKQEFEVLVKEILGYCFYKDLPFHNFFLFVGAGANGKSTLLQIFEKVIGKEFISNISLQELVNNRFASAELFQKNANISADLSSTSLKSSGYLKQLTGGDYVYAEKKFKEPFKFKNYAKLIFSCNQIPDINDESDAIYRRAVVIPFTKSFVENPNRNIVKELTNDEYEISVFAWSCISAFNDALSDGWFIYNPSISETKRVFKSYSNNVSVFVDEFLEYDPDAEVATEAVYYAYLNFCRESKLPVFDERVFGKLLFKEFGHKIYKKRVYVDDSISNWNVSNKRYYVYRCLDFKKQPNYTEEQKANLNKLSKAHLGGF